MTLIDRARNRLACTLPHTSARQVVQTAVCCLVSYARQRCYVLHMDCCHAALTCLSRCAWLEPDRSRGQARNVCRPPSDGLASAPRSLRAALSIVSASAAGHTWQQSAGRQEAAVCDCTMEASTGLAAAADHLLDHAVWGMQQLRVGQHQQAPLRPATAAPRRSLAARQRSRRHGTSGAGSGCCRACGADQREHRAEEQQAL